MDCKNCNFQLPDNSRFCIQCGNKTITKRLTVKNILSDFSNQFLNYDNKIFKTFIDLTTKPEIVIDKFINGNRKTYVNVISYLAISLSVIGFQLLVIKKLFPETLTSSTGTTGINPEVEKKITEAMMSFFDYFGLINILFIPITAVATYLVFYKNRHNYAEHIVLNIYIWAQYTIYLFLISVPLMLLGLNPSVTFTIATLATYAYYWYCFKRLYNLSAMNSLWRTIIFQLLYIIFIGLIFSIIGIIGILIYKSLN